MLYGKAEDRKATNKFHSVLTYFIKLHRLLSFLSLLWLLRQHKKQLNNYFHNQQDKKWDITPLFKRRKTGCGKKSHAKIHKTQEQRSHPQAQIPPPSADPTSKSRKYCKWFVVSFAVPTLQTTEKCERTKRRVTAHVLETIKIVKGKKGIQKTYEPMTKRKNKIALLILVPPLMAPV